MPSEPHFTPASADPERMGITLERLIDLGDTLDRVSTAAWQQISPSARAQQAERTLGGIVRQFLDGEVDASEFEVEVQRTRRLATALISSLSQAGFSAYQQIGRFDPDEIESHAKLEKRWHEGLPAANWRSYRAHVGSLDQTSVEARVLADLSKYVEQLMGDSETRERVGDDG
ncbi:MAG: hypothetical protein NCW75_03815 [Phycisphaera sp.]|nr:MAG: hypothetical protein NCW75_03815 [Phycisphaera sp.]